MPIDFDSTRWEKVRAAYRDWWSGELQRPLIPVILHGREPGRPEPNVPLLSQKTCAELAIPADQLIDRIDYELSTCIFLGDAFPHFNMDVFGPGVIAAMLGAKLDNSTGRVWFHAPSEVPIEEIRFEFDPNSIWFQRLCELYTAGMRRWQGQVLMTMTDLGGPLDVLSTFRPSENLLLDLYDSPDEVKRLTWEFHECWHKYYKALNAVLQPVNPGYSDWSQIYSDKPSYILQCDFAYMIGPGMFDEFAKPELEMSARKLQRSFYHLDGIGQLPHLDSVLTIAELDGVQWVPGHGQPKCSQWPDVYQKIARSGKKLQIMGGFDELEAVIGQIGTTRGIHVKHAGGQNEKEVRAKLAKYGID